MDRASEGRFQLFPLFVFSSATVTKGQTKQIFVFDNYRFLVQFYSATNTFIRLITVCPLTLSGRADKLKPICQILWTALDMVVHNLSQNSELTSVTCGCGRMAKQCQDTPTLLSWNRRSRQAKTVQGAKREMSSNSYFVHFTECWNLRITRLNIVFHKIK